MRHGTLTVAIGCILTFTTSTGLGQSPSADQLQTVLGLFPDPPPLSVEVLETVELEKGVRQKIEYTVEPTDRRFDRPVDRVRAYLFVPTHQKG